MRLRRRRCCRNFPISSRGTSGRSAATSRDRTRRRCFGFRSVLKTPRRRPRSNPRRTPRTTCVDSSNSFDRAPRRRCSFSKTFGKSPSTNEAERRTRATVRTSRVFCTRRLSPRSRTGTIRARPCFDGWRARRAKSPARSGARFSIDCETSRRRPSRPPWAGWTSPSGPERPKTRIRNETNTRCSLDSQDLRPGHLRVSGSIASGGWCAVR